MTTPNVVLDDTFRDDLARALRNARHSAIAKQTEEEHGDQGSDCGGHGGERCGGCSQCLYMQATWSDYTEEGWALFVAQADELIESLRAQAEYRAHGVRWPQ